MEILVYRDGVEINIMKGIFTFFFWIVVIYVLEDLIKEKYIKYNYFI